MAGEITLPESRELSELERNNPDFYYYGLLSNEVFEAKIDFKGEILAASQEDSFRSILKKINKEPVLSNRTKTKSFLLLKIMAAAAILMLILGGLFWFGTDRLTVNAKEQLVITEKGSKSRIILPDGSKVWINSDSKLTYGDNYGKDNRVVQLSGEAFFEVVKDKNHPFIVHTRSIDVKVLGTIFNVRAYENERNTQTTLLRGSVEVFLKGKSNKKILLRPNEKIIVQNNDNQLKSIVSDPTPKTPEISILEIDKNSIDSNIDNTQWVQNKLVFYDEGLESIIPTLERWYNVKILVNNPALTSMKFSGKFEDDTLIDVLESLKISSGINYKIKKNIVIIY